MWVHSTCLTLALSFLDYPDQGKQPCPTAFFTGGTWVLFSVQVLHSEKVTTQDQAQAGKHSPNLQYDLVTMTGKKMVFRYVDCLGENNMNLMQLWMSGLRGPSRPYQTGRFRLISESHSQMGCSHRDAAPCCSNEIWILDTLRQKLGGWLSGIQEVKQNHS